MFSYMDSVPTMWRKANDIYDSPKNRLEAISTLIPSLGPSQVSHNFPSRLTPGDWLQPSAKSYSSDQKNYKLQIVKQEDYKNNRAKWPDLKPCLEFIIPKQLQMHPAGISEGEGQVWREGGSTRLMLHAHWSWASPSMGPGTPGHCVDVTATFAPLTVKLWENFWNAFLVFIGRCTCSRYFHSKREVIGNLQHIKS